MRRSLPILLSWLMVLSFPGCRGAQGPFAKKLTGSVETSDARLTDALPHQPPRTVYVADFALDAADIQPDQGARGMLPKGLGGGLVGNLGQRLPHPLAGGDPASQAREIVDAMAGSLVAALGDRGIQAQRIDVASADLPRDGWLLQGVFTEVDEGNRIKRAVIGFGQGATRMNVQVGVSDLAGAQPRQAFIVFGTVKEPGKMPGAAVTMNPYVAAAKFVLEKNATGRDIRDTAGQIADVLVESAATIRREAASRHTGLRE